MATIKLLKYSQTCLRQSLMGNVKSDLSRGSLKMDQSCHQMDCQALSCNTFCTCIYECKWTYKLCWI